MSRPQVSVNRRH